MSSTISHCQDASSDDPLAEHKKRVRCRVLNLRIGMTLNKSTGETVVLRNAVLR